MNPAQLHVTRGCTHVVRHPKWSRSLGSLGDSRHFDRTRQSLTFGGMKWTEHITAEPNVCHGKACIRGTRVMVSVALDNLAAGLSPADIVGNYPSLHLDDISAAISYAAELARERVVTTPPGMAT